MTLQRTQGPLWAIVAFAGKFERPKELLQDAGISQPILHMHPLRVYNATCPLRNGSQSAAATHAALWALASKRQRDIIIFEEDIAFKNARIREAMWQMRAVSSDVFFLGYCGRAACTHAYRVSSSGAGALLSAYRRHGGCVESDEPIMNLCTKSVLNCRRASGMPGLGLWGNGAVGQNKSLRRYLHDKQCSSVPIAMWPTAGCRTRWDYSKFADTTIPH